MFHSAILKLTGWYLLILMGISLLFSFAIYHAATSEVRDRLMQFETSLEQPNSSGEFSAPNHHLFSSYREDQRDLASRNILTMLVYVNLLIFFGGGVLSYLLARRTLYQIELAHDAQARFASDASHELRTPLTAIKTELEVALRNPKLSKSEMNTLLESNLEEVNKLTSLSKTLLQLSKLGHADLEMSPIDLGVVVNEVIQRYDKNADRITFSAPSRSIVIKGNLASIEELVTILVDNALKYSPKDSRIKAALVHGSRETTFTISNKGAGIPADKLQHVFERFYRVNESRTDGGSGLGLALAKDIVARHKGELSVSSRLNGNTTFMFSLPITRKTQA